MKQSQLFTKTIKDISKEEISNNAQLLTRAGFIDKLMVGVYSYLPLGYLVLEKIEKIIKEEMNKIGGQELLMPALTPKEPWLKTDRWKYEEMFKLKNRSEKEFGLGWTHEEVITPLVQKFIRSYKDLPVFAYQIQTKFRDELRSKSGLLRGVEFIMKDFYSFHQDDADLDKFYEKIIKAYFEIFKRCGLGKQTFLTYASGGAFSKYSHEFQTITPYGEDEIYFCKKCKLAINKEIIAEENNACPKCKSKNLEINKSIEVGNIFKLGERYSKAFNFNYTGKDGQQKLVKMGCYGIGPSRLMGTIVELHHDDRGIIWPKEVSPFNIHLIQIEDNAKCKKASEGIYDNLQKQGFGVLYDDRTDKSAGEKFADADLIGISIRIVVSERTIKEDSVEVKEREDKNAKLIKIKSLPNLFKTKK
jgi:prolyl-tRNA synthetase